MRYCRQMRCLEILESPRDERNKEISIAQTAKAFSVFPQWKIYACLALHDQATHTKRHTIIYVLKQCSQKSHTSTVCFMPNAEKKTCLSHTCKIVKGWERERENEFQSRESWVRVEREYMSGSFQRGARQWDYKRGCLRIENVFKKLRFHCHTHDWMNSIKVLATPMSYKILNVFSMPQCRFIYGGTSCEMPFTAKGCHVAKIILYGTSRTAICAHCTFALKKVLCRHCLSRASFRVIIT